MDALGHDPTTRSAHQHELPHRPVFTCDHPTQVHATGYGLAGVVCAVPRCGVGARGMLSVHQRPDVLAGQIVKGEPGRAGARWSFCLSPFLHR